MKNYKKMDIRRGITLSKSAKDSVREANKRCKSLSSVVKLINVNFETSDKGKGYKETFSAIGVKFNTAPTVPDVLKLIEGMREGDFYYTFETARDTEKRAIKGHIVKRFVKVYGWTPTRLVTMIDQAIRKEEILSVKILVK